MATSSAMSTSNTYIKYTISVTQNSQSVANNTSNVTVKVRFYRTNTGYSSYGTGTVYCKINGVTYSASVTNSQKITSDGIYLFSKTLNISHGTNGAKTLTCSAWISHSVVTSDEQSYSQTLTTIPRKSTLSVGNGTLGVSQTLTVTKRSDSFTHTITAVCGTASSASAVCTKSSSASVSFTPPLSWASQNKMGTSVSVKYTITTYSGSSSIGSVSYTKTCAIPSSVKPTISSVTVSDAMGYKDTYGVYLQGLSKFKIAVSASGSYSSTITSYKIQANGSTYTSATATTSAVSASGSNTISVTVTDSRGRTASKSVSVSVSSYARPTIMSFTAYRCDSDGTSNDQGAYIKTSFYTMVNKIADSDGNAQNTSSYTLKYRKRSESTWTNIDTSELSGYYGNSLKSYIFSADTGSSYVVSLTVADNFGSTAKTVSASTATTLLHFNASGNGVGIGKISENENTLDVNYKTMLRNGLTVQGYPITADKDIRSSENVQAFGNFKLAGAATSATSLSCLWNDEGTHDLVGRGSDGLKCYIGAGNIGTDYQTVTYIRGYTVRLYNHGGGTYLGASGSTAVTSDRNLKKDIFDMGENYVEFFKKLRPVSYKYNSEDNNGHRDHLGFIAQEVEDALTESGLTTEQFAGICIENDVTLDYNDDTSLTDEERAANKIHYDKLYSLRYEEFIALNTHMIQRQQAVIAELQSKIDELEARLSALEKTAEG